MNAKDGQRLSTKQGEIEFRRKLASQQSEADTVIFPEAHTREEILEIMSERATATRKAITKLSQGGASVSPFLELGAERCQRALALENEFDARGIAVGISFDMLRFASVVAQYLDYKKMPLRICCDAYDLPIRDDALQFAFCYQTLHHFPDPSPICKEIVRVLGNQGVLYFDEEPVKGAIKRITRLYSRRGYRLNPLEKLLEKLNLLSVVSKADELEVDTRHLRRRVQHEDLAKGIGSISEC